jgi:glyoxylase-like metal-dependent hydrolase (beta-lactamase superfamily II)
VHEKYVLGDETRAIEIHHVPGLAHAAGMLIVYLPKEKIVVEADLYTPPTQGEPPAAINASNRTFQRALQSLKLNVETIVPIHGRSGSMAEFTQFMNR